MFGDSYTTPDLFVDSKDSFWGRTACELKIPTIVNCSRSVNSFTSVQHLLVGFSNSIDWDNDLIFLGIPPLERVTIFDDYKDTEYIGSTITTETWDVEQFTIPQHHGLICEQNFGNDKFLVLHSDRSWIETDTLRQIFLLTQWLDRVKSNYLILNLSRDFDSNNVWGPSDFVLPYCQSHKNCLLFENTYRNINLEINKPVDFDRYGWNGHHGAAGNKRFFELAVLKKLKELNLC